MEQRILRLADVVAAVGLGKSAIYAAVAKGEFPPPVQLSARARGWRSGDIEQWIKTRPAAEVPTA